MARVHSAKSAVRIVIDVVMAAVYVALMATALVQEAPHEYLGIAMFALAVAHVGQRQMSVGEVNDIKGLLNPDMQLCFDDIHIDSSV